MQRTFKRTLALALVVIMLVSAVPFGGSITANAAGGVKSKLDSFISSYPSGSRWTGYFDGGKQCYGFGKLVIYNIFGKYGSSYRSWSYQGVSTSGMNSIGSITSYSSSNVKSLLSKAKCGDVLQFDYTKQHTMIVYSVESDGVWIYDCNWDNNCGISLRKCSFGAWSERNSAKLTLLRSNNYDSIEGPAVTHTVDSNYGKNYTAYLNNPGTNHYVFDANHNSTSHYVNGSDPCTIHEVYTDGCCYFTYSLDSGSTRSAYGKISWFKPAHTHNYTTKLYEPAHPHRISIRCSDYDSCGGWKWTDEYYTNRECSQCWSLKLTPSVSSLSLEVGDSTTASFNISGVYPSDCKVYFEYDSTIISYSTSNGIFTFKALKAGTTKFTVKAYSKDKSASGAVFMASTSIKITVTAHTHSYQEEYEADHPHKIYKKCSCGYWYYTGKNATDYNCTQCCDNATYTLTASPASLTMYVGETKTVTFTESSSGFTVYMNGKYNTSMFSNVSFGNWIDGCKRKVTFTATKAGTGTIVIELKAALTDKVMKTLVYNVNILPDTYTVSYNANGGSGAPSSQTKNYKTALTLSSTKPTRTGYTFLGWSTSSTATSATYSAGGSYTSNSNVTLYAVWKANTYTVRYNANGGTGAPSSQTKTYGKNLTLSSTKPTRTGYTFLGWSTSSTATSATYSAGGNYTSNSSVTLYAVWKKTDVYKITYNANGGTGAPPMQSLNNGSGFISNVKPSKKGYDFIGWSVFTEADKVDFYPNDTIITKRDITLYAVWKINHTHSYMSTTDEAPTCVSEGTVIYTCSACGDTYSEPIPAMGHIDDDNDGKCDLCDKDIVGGGAADCDHICHKGGFAGFIYKIIRVFWKLFKINKTCACGVNHY